MCDKSKKQVQNINKKVNFVWLDGHSTYKYIVFMGWEDKSQGLRLQKRAPHIYTLKLG